MADPTVSVIIPNFNHARFLPRRVESVLSQTYRDFELILLDDCSTDESREMLEGYRELSDKVPGGIRLELNEVNSGSTFKQWNKGIRLARGKYIWLAESDDFADEQLLAKLVAELDRDERVVFAYARSHRVSTDGGLHGYADWYLEYLSASRWTRDFEVDGKDECMRYLSCRNTIPNASAVLFRRASYEAVGGADESMRLCGDWRLWALLAMTGRVVYLGQPLNYYRFHPESVRTSSHLGVEALESLAVAKMMREILHMAGQAREMQRHWLVWVWMKALFNREVPLVVKWAVLKAAWELDPAVPWIFAREIGARLPRRIGLVRAS